MNHKLSLYSADYASTRSHSCGERLNRFVTRSCQTSVIHALISSELQQQQTNPMKKTAASQTACARCVRGGLIMLRQILHFCETALAPSVNKHRWYQFKFSSDEIWIIWKIYNNGCLESLACMFNAHGYHVKSSLGRVFFLSLGVIWFLNWWQLYSWRA